MRVLIRKLVLQLRVGMSVTPGMSAYLARLALDSGVDSLTSSLSENLSERGLNRSR